MMNWKPEKRNRVDFTDPILSAQRTETDHYHNSLGLYSVDGNCNRLDRFAAVERKLHSSRLASRDSGGKQETRTNRNDRESLVR
jgi:hypothetical protein